MGMMIMLMVGHNGDNTNRVNTIDNDNAHANINSNTSTTYYMQYNLQLVACCFGAVLISSWRVSALN